MADNLTTQSGTPATVPSASVIATDDVAGVHFQRVKLVDGTADSSVAIAGDATNGLDVDVTRVQGTVTVSGPLTDTQLRATAVPVSGTVGVSGAVSVTGPLTDTQLRATAVPVSGTFWQATQPVSGTVGIDSATNTVKIDGTTNTVKLDSTQVTTLTPPAAITGFATETTLGVINGKVPSLTSGAVPIWDNNSSITVDGTVGLSANTSVGLNPLTDANGLSKYYYAAVGSSSDTQFVKASAGRIYGWVFTNISASPVYIKFYESASAPTYGAAGPKLNIMIPGNTSGAGIVAADFAHGIYFPTGIAFTVTGGIADTSTTTVSASSVLINIIYK